MRTVVSAKEIGRKIRKLRLAKGESTVAMAKSLKITRQHVNHIEAGRRNLTLERLHAITRHLGVPVDAILGSDTKRKSA